MIKLLKSFINRMDIICNHNICTGCQACRLACPMHCISMKEDARGNIYPEIDNTKCINCNLCRKICPSLSPPSFSEKPLNVYAGWAKDKLARQYSTSGGISYALSKYFLKNQDYFCGAIWTKNGAIHKLTSNQSDIKSFQGSKYSHSDVKDCYKEVSDKLKYGKKVLFTGTPCQIAGLRKFLGKEYDNLYTVDIICHGVPSRRILRDRIHDIEQSNGKEVIEMRFRDKNPDQLHTCCKYIFKDKSFVLHEYSKDFFCRSYVDNYALRENCFNCQYSRLQRVSDLTIADFWSFQPKSMKFYNYELGVSIIIVNTKRGQELINYIKNNIIYEERSYTECSNRNLYESQLKPKDYEAYWNDYDNNIPKAEIQKKYLSCPIPHKKSFSDKVRKFANAFFPNIIMDSVRSILKLIRKK